MIRSGTPTRPENAVSAPGMPRNDREIDDVRPGQELAECQGFGEFPLVEPAPPLDQHVARPGQHAAESGKRDREKAGEQFGKFGNF